MLTALLSQGDGVHRMMQATGEQGVSLEDYVVYQKALLLDMVFLRQDAHDPVDLSVALQRQKESCSHVRALVTREYPFRDKDEARAFFTRLTGLFKKLNYPASEARQRSEYRSRIDDLVLTLGRDASAGAGQADGAGAPTAAIASTRVEPAAAA